MKRIRSPNLGIRTKLFLLLLGLVVVPFLFYTTLLVGQVSAQMESLGFHTAELVLGQTSSYLESRFDLVKRALDLVALNPTVQELSAADPEAYSRDPGLWIRDAAALHAVEDNAGQNNPDLRQFVLYMAGGLGASLSRDESPQFRALADQVDQPWYRSLDPRENLPQWFSPSTPFDHADPDDLHALRRIASDLDLSVTVGYIRVDLRSRGMEEILDKAEFSVGTATFLVDQYGIPVARSERAKALGDAALSALVTSAPGPWPAVTVGDTVYRIGRAPIDATGWSLVTAIPHRDIGAFGDQVRTLLLALLALILPLMVPLSLWAASSSTRRLDSLLKGVRQLGDGSLDIALPVDGRDEIGELTRSFNGMVHRIRELVEERYRLGLEVKHLELEALQAQINPHFLYNTLDLINGLALLSGQGRIVDTVSALSKFYRLSLAGGADTIPLSDELEHASAYVRIQNLRFDNAIELAVECQAECAAVPILKTILQPLVENAILHGILEKPEEKGRLVLRAWGEGEGDERSLVLEVEDDGVGMEPSLVTGLLARERVGTGRGHGYGVFNIDRRLRLRYGDEAGLRFDSALGRGTRVRVRLPYSLP